MHEAREARRSGASVRVLETSTVDGGSVRDPFGSPTSPTSPASGYGERRGSDVSQL